MQHKSLEMAIQPHISLRPTDRFISQEAALKPLIHSSHRRVTLELNTAHSNITHNTSTGITVGLTIPSDMTKHLLT